MGLLSRIHVHISSGNCDRYMYRDGLLQLLTGNTTCVSHKSCINYYSMFMARARTQIP